MATACTGSDGGGAFDSGETGGPGFTSGDGDGHGDGDGDGPDPSGGNSTGGGDGDDGTDTGPDADPKDCGNGDIDPGETCDLQNFGGKSCRDFDAANGAPFTAGSLTCNTVSCQIQTNSCTQCGDGYATGAEDCDGADLGFSDCRSEGFESGELRCNADCTLDTSMCAFCGDGEVNVGEDCDGSVGSEDCLSQGFASGTLRCTDDCRWDTSQCELCGDGIIGGSERCDCGDDPATCTQVQLGRTSCQDLPAPVGGNFSGGPLACNGTCDGYDTVGCTICGDGIRDPQEACDGEDLGGATCADAGFLPGFTGTVSCAADCTLDAALCEGPRCGVSEPRPPDGDASCGDLWEDGPNGCERTCTVGTCEIPIDCPADRRCELNCIGSTSCNNRTINCAEDRSCRVLCDGSSACGGATIVCPPGADCHVECDSTNACSSATIICPEGDFSCNVECSGTGACLSAVMQCGGGPCTMRCAGSTNACEGTQMQCGSDSCEATCFGTTIPQVTCGDSCGCVTC